MTRKEMRGHTPLVDFSAVTGVTLQGFMIKTMWNRYNALYCTVIPSLLCASSQY